MLKTVNVMEYPYVFEYQADNTLDHIVINSYELNENGKWVLLNGGGGHKVYDDKGKIILNTDVIGKGIDIRIEYKNGMLATEYEASDYLNEKVGGDGISSLISSKITYETEIPLLIQVVTKSNGCVCNGVESFLNHRCI